VSRLFDGLDHPSRGFKLFYIVVVATVYNEIVTAEQEHDSSSIHDRFSAAGAGTTRKRSHVMMIMIAYIY